jgi:disulfide bond formation protein DsbB
MTGAVSAINQAFSLFTVVGDILALVLLAGLFFEYSGARLRWMCIFKNRGLWLVFGTALISMIVSLYYSDIVGYEPCKFCWLARIFMYPQVFLLGMAFWKKESRRFVDYSLILSIIGLLITGYQLLLQAGLVPTPPCAATGAVSCTKIYFEYFGYVTIPAMAFTAFALMTEFALAEKISANLENSKNN